MEDQSQLKVVSRWIAFFPAAVGASWLAWFVTSGLQKLAAALQGVNPESFFIRIAIEVVPYAVMGAAFVYSGAKIAPGYREVVAYCLAGTALVFAGVALFSSLMFSDYWSVFGTFALILGAGFTGYAIGSGDLSLD